MRGWRGHLLWQFVCGRAGSVRRDTVRIPWGGGTRDSNEIEWNLDDNGTLTISGTGDPDYSTWKSMWWDEEERDKIKRAVVNVAGMTDASSMFRYCKNLESVDLCGFDTSSVTDMSYMFDGCGNLSGLDVSGFDTSNVTNMSGMFNYCSSLSSLDVSGFDTSKVESMHYMFADCSNLANLDPSGFDTSNVTDMCGMFIDCGSLKSLDVSSFNTSQVMNMSEMFDGCSSLSSLNVSGFNTSQVTDMRWMFSDCSGLKSLDYNNFNTSRVTDMGRMFSGCSSLNSLYLDNFDTSQVTDMSYMFGFCDSLKSLDLSSFQTPNVITMNFMFYHCGNLNSLDISSFITENIDSSRNMFNLLSCEKLSVVKMPANLKEEIQLPGVGWKDENQKNCSKAAILPVPMTYTKGTAASSDSGDKTEGNKPDSGIKDTDTGDGGAQGQKTPLSNGTKLTDKKSAGKYMVTSPSAVMYMGTANKKAKSVTIPATITNDNGTFQVTAIADNAFKGNTKITGITIGKNITKIGKNAFKKCKIKVPASKVKSYKTKFKNKGQKPSVKISK